MPQFVQWPTKTKLLQWTHLVLHSITQVCNCWTLSRIQTTQRIVKEPGVMTGCTHLAGQIHCLVTRCFTLCVAWWTSVRIWVTFHVLSTLHWSLSSPPSQMPIFLETMYSVLRICGLGLRFGSSKLATLLHISSNRVSSGAFSDGFW